MVAFSGWITRMTVQTRKLPARNRRAALATMALSGCFGAAIAAPGDVRPQVFLVGKTVNYRQAADGSLTRLNYHFFAEISLPRDCRTARRDSSIPMAASCCSNPAETT